MELYFFPGGRRGGGDFFIQAEMLRFKNTFFLSELDVLPAHITVVTLD